MEDRDLYKQRFRAQMEEWKAGLDVLRAKADGATAEARIEINARVKAAEEKLEEAKAALAEMDDSKDDAWDSAKAKAESIWDSIKSTVSDTISKVTH